MSFQIQVKLFGSLKEFSRGSSVCINVAAPLSVLQLRAELSQALVGQNTGCKDRVDRILAVSAIADETQILASDAAINRSCELAVLPPVCGG